MRRAVRRKNGNENVYVPVTGRIEEILRQTEDTSLFRIKTGSPLRYKPGQFFMVSVWGAGEVPLSAASLCEDDTVEFSVRRAGVVTKAIHGLRNGEVLWFRGPYGNGFSLEPSRERDVVLVAGGIGIAPLRPLIQSFIRKPEGTGKVTLLYGSRTPESIVFRDEVEGWSEKGIKAALTVDRAGEDWKGYTGLVTGLWHEVSSDFKEASAYLCGPEIMIKAAMRALSFFGMPEERIITSLEAHMKCGVGKCGHCYAGPKYICTDGPVFSYKEIKEYALLR